MTDRDPRTDVVAASDLSSAAVLAALIGVPGAKSVLSDEEVRDVYEAAREIIEAQLRPDQN